MSAALSSAMGRAHASHTMPLCTVPNLPCRRRGWLPPAPLRSAATLATLLLLSHWTFWHSANVWGVTQSSIDSLVAVGSSFVIFWQG